jgi:hypothetical protein
MASRTKFLELWQDHLTDEAQDGVSGHASNFGKTSSFIVDRANALSNGQSVCDRRSAQGSLNSASGDLMLSYFTSCLGLFGEL